MFSQLHNQHHQHNQHPSAVSPRGHAGGVDPRSEDLHHVALGVYIGSHYVLKSAQPLLKRGIRTVVNAAIEFVTESPELINWEDLQRNGIEVHNAMLDDTLAQPIFPSPSLEAAVKKIDEVVRAGNSVLVNCAMGKSRSTSLVIAYLMARQGMTYDQAFAACKRARPLCQPNANFERQLRQLEASLRSALPAVSAASPPASPASPLHSPLHRQTSFTSPHSPSHSAPHSPHFPSANSFTGLSSPLGNSTAGNGFGHGYGSFRGGAGDWGSATVSRNPYSTNNIPPQSPPRNSPASPPRSPFAHPPVSPRAAPSPGYGGASSLRGPASPLVPTVTGASGVGSPGLGGLGSGYGGGYGGHGNAGGLGSPYGSLYNNNNYRGAGNFDLGSLGMRRLSL